MVAGIAGRHKAIDLLVHSVWGGYEQYDAALFRMPDHEQPVWRFARMIASGVRAQYVTTRALLPLLRRRSLIACVSAGDRGTFLGDLQCDIAKAAVERLAFALTRRLQGEGIVALALHPGFTRTERVVAEAPPEALATTHSARLVGRAVVVALATDPHVASRAGGAHKVGQLRLDYGFTDVDGSQPEPFVIPDRGERALARACGFA